LAEQSGLPGWIFTLHAPSFQPVMQYAQCRELRETLYYQYGTRASEFGKSEWDNTQLIKKLLALRAEEAQLLGFDNYSALSLAVKMAESPAAVLEFLRDLSARAKPYAERDWRELQEFARETLGLEAMEPWDVGFVSEKLRVQRYDFSDFRI